MAVCSMLMLAATLATGQAPAAEGRNGKPAAGSTERTLVADHATANPVFRQLIEDGILPRNPAGRLPRPTMPDGLDAAEQRKIVARLGYPRHSFSKLTANKSVAPYIVDIKGVKSNDPQRPLRSIEFWFVGFASLDAMTDKKFLDSMMMAGQREGQGRGLGAEELAARNISLVDKDHDGYGTVAFDLISKVHLQATGRSFWTRTKDSILTAAIIDPRFLADPELPNQWQPLDREGRRGEPTSYDGGGLYMKLTQMQAPQKGVFVECHILGIEPKAWFGGRNLLLSKLPPAIQKQVRSSRVEMQTADKKARLQPAQ